MKQQLSTLIIMLLVGVVVAYFSFNLNKEYVDLRYTLSEKIPTEFIGASPAETVQQLVVKNNGNMPATKIQIKINGFVKDHDIVKNLSSDVVEEHKSKDNFEAIYPSLPPEGQFSYIFKTSGKGITKDNLEIKHNKGKAKEALASETQSNLKGFLLLSVLVIYLFWGGKEIYSTATNFILSGGAYTSYHDYLNKKKPIYISEEKWYSARKKFIEESLQLKYLHPVNDIEDREYYKILNQDKPNFVTE